MLPLFSSLSWCTRSRCTVSPFASSFLCSILQRTWEHSIVQCPAVVHIPSTVQCDFD
jgi:hypothetical protein